MKRPKAGEVWEVYSLDYPPDTVLVCLYSSCTNYANCFIMFHSIGELIGRDCFVGRDGFIRRIKEAE